MKNHIVKDFFIFQYPIKNWEEKKIKIKSQIDFNKFIRKETFWSDRTTSNNLYLSRFIEIFKEDFNQFGIDLCVKEFNISKVWTVFYDQWDYQQPHNHSSTGYSGLIYLDFYEAIHEPTVFISPISNPITDKTDSIRPTVHEGSIIFFPSNILHHSPPNHSSSRRSVISFDLNF